MAARPAIFPIQINAAPHNEFVWLGDQRQEWLMPDAGSRAGPDDAGGFRTATLPDGRNALMRKHFALSPV
jgi:hypothetical protein